MSSITLLASQSFGFTDPFVWSRRTPPLFQALVPEFYLTYPTYNTSSV